MIQGARPPAETPAVAPSGAHPEARPVPTSKEPAEAKAARAGEAPARAPSKPANWTVLGALQRWGRSLHIRLLVVNLIVLLVPVAGLEFARLFERELLRALERDMRHQAVATRIFVESSAGWALSQRTDGPQPASLSENTLKRIARHTRMRLRILDRQGKVVLDSHRDGPPEGQEPAAPALLPQFDGVLSTGLSRPQGRPWKPIPKRPEVLAALSGERGSFTRVRQQHPSVLLFVTEPIFDAQAKVDGAVYVTRSTQPVMVELYRIRNGLWKLLSLALVGSVAITLLLALSITRPLARLSRAARRIADGAYNLELPVSGSGEIRELSQSFRKMTETLRQRLRDTAAFAADVAHAFKSPLTSIRGAAELLEEGAADEPEARKRFLKNIELDADRLDRLVSRLLQLGRIEASEQPFLPLLLAPMLEEAAERSEVPDVAISVECPANLQVAARATDLLTAIANLLDNSVRASAAGGSVSVQVVGAKCAAQRPGTKLKPVASHSQTWLTLSVTDQGAGIPQALHKRVFERFYTTDSEQGTGLGLAISKAVVEAHGGTLELDTQYNQGARFVIRLRQWSALEG